MKIKTNHLLKLTSRKFTWSRFRGVADLTDLINPNERLKDTLLRQIYPDACDAGFVVVSGRTQSEVIFLYVRDMSREGECTGWLFRSLCGRYQIEIVND